MAIGKKKEETEAAEEITEQKAPEKAGKKAAKKGASEKGEKAGKKTAAEEKDTAGEKGGKKKKKKDGEKKGKKERKEKGQKGGKSGLIVLIILILLVAGFLYASIYFDIGGIRVFLADSLEGAMAWLNPEFKHVNDRLADAERAETDILAREAALQAEQTKLADSQERLANDQRTLKEEKENSVPIYRDQLTEQQLEDMTSVSRIYASISPEDAADILSRLYTNEDIAAILYYMNEKNAGAILAVMDPGLAAQITTLLLRD